MNGLRLEVRRWFQEAQADLAVSQKQGEIVVSRIDPVRW